ncbi:MAG: SRPBCC family protein [Hyphomicrobiales bacterium]
MAWQYWVEPEKMLRWQSGITGWDTRPNDRGRTGPGAVSHCEHGAGVSQMLTIDWRPFEYFTYEQTALRRRLMLPPPNRYTVLFEEDGEGGTWVELRSRMHSRGLPTRLKVLAMRPVVRRAFRKDEARLNAILGAAGAAPEQAGESESPVTRIAGA